MRPSVPSPAARAARSSASRAIRADAEREGHFTASGAAIPWRVGRDSPPGRRTAADYGLQVVLADFIADGHFAAHVRRMREVYAERRDAFLAAFKTHLDGMVRTGSLEGAFQTVLWLPAGADEAAVSAAALRMGLDLPPLSRFRLEPSDAPGLMLTYGGEPPERIEAGIKQLAVLLESTLRPAAVAA